MRFLLDTDVLLDLALDRRPFSEAAGRLLDALEARPGSACIAWHSASNFYYLVAPEAGDRAARRFLTELVGFVEVAPTTGASLRAAAELPLKDFEDALQVAAAAAGRAGRIVTRNLKDFRASPIPAMTPEEALAEFFEA